jgi:drug/metabolite transporter (DMT)-like permease
LGEDDVAMNRARIAVVVAIVSVGTAAVMIRYADSGPLTVAFYRMVFSTLFLVPWVLLYDREQIARLSSRDWLRLACVGLVLAAHFSLWITSVSEATELHTTVANSAVLVTTHPLFVALIAAVYLKERPSHVALLGGALALAGVAVMFYGDYGGGGFVGDVLAVGGAVAAGIYLIAGRSERRSLSTGTYCIVVYGFAALFLMPLAFFESGLEPASGNDWFVFILMAAVPGILGHTLYNYALGKVSAFFVSTTLLGEPIISTVLAWWLLSEMPSEWAYLGAPLVLAGILMASGIWQSGGQKNGAGAG